MMLCLEFLYQVCFLIYNISEKRIHKILSLQLRDETVVLFRVA